MKIALVGPVYPYRGGIAHYTTLLAQALVAHRHSVQVISFKRQYPAWLYPGSSDKDPSQHALRLEAQYCLDPVYPWTWNASASKILEYKPDLAIINWWVSFWAPAFSRLASRLRQAGIPVLYLIHNVIPHEAKPWDRFLTRRALGQGDAFIVQTSREKERLLALLPQAVAELCPHPIYDMFAGQHLPKAEARQLLGLPQDVPVLLFFGIVRPYKGLKYLIQCLAESSLQAHQPFLLVAGEIWQEKSGYAEQIQNLGLAGRVRLEDRYIPNEEVALYFCAADLLVAPYVQGTQSGAIKMALGFGLPVVASHTIADETLLALEGRGVFFASPERAGELAAAIAASLQASAGSSPVERVDSAATWERLVKTIERAGARLNAGASRSGETGEQPEALEPGSNAGK